MHPSIVPIEVKPGKQSLEGCKIPALEGERREEPDQVSVPVGPVLLQRRQTLSSCLPTLQIAITPQK